MSEPSRLILDLVDSVIDHRAIEWDTTRQGVMDPEERQKIDVIRHLARISDASNESQIVETRRWGHFELLEKLGEGGSGEVYRARDTRLEREVALKLYHQEILGGSSKRLLSEGQRHSRVEHSNIVTIYGSEEHEGRVGISMELIHGRTLQELSQLAGYGPFSAAEAAFIGRELCRSLGAVHARGLTHGDVKASNIMREVGGRIVLMDFSASRPVAEHAGAPEDVAGTPLYMAPEVLSGGRPTERSDLYSLGVLLFYLVTGRYPVFGESLSALRDAYRKGARRSLHQVRPDLPEEFVRAVELCLAPDPKNRIESAGSLAALLTPERADMVAKPLAQLIDALSRAVKGFGHAIRSIEASARLFAKVVLYGAGVAGILLTLGFLTTMTYNVGLGLDELGFAPRSSFFDYVSWGARALVLPAFIAFSGALLYSLGSMVFRWTPRPVQAAFERTLARLTRPIASSPRTMAQAFLLSAYAAFAAVYLTFSDLVEAVMGIGGKEPGTESGFEVLSPADEAYHNNYYIAFTILILLLAWGLSRVLRRLKDEPASSTVVALGTGAAIVLSLALLVTPYRILTHNESPRATFEGRPAYVVGRKDSRLLLFIPTEGIPEKRVVADDDPRLELDPKNERENVFTLYE